MILSSAFDFLMAATTKAAQGRTQCCVERDEGEVQASRVPASKTCLPTLLLQVVGLGDPEVPAALVHAPLTLAPVPFPREAFQRAKCAATVRTETLCIFIRFGSLALFLGNCARNIHLQHMICMHQSAVYLLSVKMGVALCGLQQCTAVTGPVWQ